MESIILRLYWGMSILMTFAPLWTTEGIHAWSYKNSTLLERSYQFLETETTTHRTPSGSFLPWIFFERYRLNTENQKADPRMIHKPCRLRVDLVRGYRYPGCIQKTKKMYRREYFDFRLLFSPSSTSSSNVSFVINDSSQLLWNTDDYTAPFPYRLNSISWCKNVYRAWLTLPHWRRHYTSYIYKRTDTPFCDLCDLPYDYRSTYDL